MGTRARLACSLALALSAALPQAAVAQDNPLQQVFGIFNRLLGTKASTLKELVDQKKFEEAARFQEENEADLRSDAEAIAPLLNAIAAGLNAEFDDPMAALASRLSAAQPEAIAQWPSVRDDLAQARALLDKYDGFGLLRAAPYRSARADELQRAVAACPQSFEGAAPRVFAAVALRQSVDFFAAYPVDLDRTAVVAAAEGAIRAALSAARREDLQAFMRNYGSYAGPSLRDEISERSARALLQEKAPGGRPTLAQIGELLRELAADGADARMLPFRVALAVVRSQPGDRSFTLRGEAGLEPQETTAEALQGLALAADFLYVVHVLSAPPVRRDVRVRRESSRFVSGKSMVPNPRYAEALQAYEQAQRTLNEIKSSHDQIQDQARQNAAGGMGGFLGALNATIAVGSFGVVAKAESDVNTARAALNDTPQMVEQETYAAYSYPVTEVEVRAPLAVSLHVIDARSGVYARRLLDLGRTQRFELANGLNPLDPDRAQILRASASEDQVAGFRAASERRLSELLADAGLLEQRNLRAVQELSNEVRAEAQRFASAVDSERGMAAAASARARAEAGAQPADPAGAGQRAQAPASAAPLAANVDQACVTRLRRARIEMLRIAQQSNLYAQRMGSLGSKETDEIPDADCSRPLAANVDQRSAQEENARVNLCGARALGCAIREVQAGAECSAGQRSCLARYPIPR